MQIPETEAQPAPPRTRRGASWTIALVVAVLVYFAPLFYLSANQRRLIFPAKRYTDADWAAARIPAGAARVSFPAGRERVAAVFGSALTANGLPDPDGRRRLTLLYFHGNGSDLLDDLGDFQRLRRLDVNVMMPDYPGYGLSTGLPSESGCYAAAAAAYADLTGRFDVAPKRLVLVGHSLGTAVAVDLAAREQRAGRPPAALALFSGFTSMPEEAHHQYPLYPTALLRLFVRFHFDSERKLATVACPVFVAHSLSDEVIPYAMARRLAAAVHGPVTRLTIDHVPHGYVFSTGAPQIFPAFSAFLKGIAADASSGRFPSRPLKGRAKAPEKITGRP